MADMPNAITHGNVIPFGLGARALYEELGFHLMNQYNPKTPAQLELVATLHESEWQLRRTICTMTRIIAVAMDEHYKVLKAEKPEFDHATLRECAMAKAYIQNDRLNRQLIRDEIRLRKVIDECTQALRPRYAVR